MDVKKIKILQEKELKSKRFWNVCEFLCCQYWNRFSIGLEDELFDLSFGKNKDYEEFLKFIKKINKTEKDSNIFFSKTFEYLELAHKDVPMITNKINCDSDDQTVVEISPEHKNKFMHRVPTFMKMKSDNKNFLVPILSEKRIYMYDEYNDAVDKLNKIASSIFYNELSKNCHIDNFQINSNGDKYIAFKSKIKTLKK